jgi:hypothetical protein
MIEERLDDDDDDDMLVSFHVIYSHCKPCSEMDVLCCLSLNYPP